MSGDDERLMMEVANGTMTYKTAWSALKDIQTYVRVTQGSPVSDPSCACPGNFRTHTHTQYIAGCQTGAPQVTFPF